MKRLILKIIIGLQKRFCSIVHRYYMYDIKLKRTQFSIEEPLEEKKSTRRQFEVNLHFESE